MPVSLGIGLSLNRWKPAGGAIPGSYPTVGGFWLAVNGVTLTLGA